MSNQLKSIYEYVLWDNCQNHCTFCWQNRKPNLLRNIQKINVLDTLITELKSDNFQKNSHILLVGGEIFDEGNLEISAVLKIFFQNIVKLQVSNIIDLVYINTNLIYKDTSILESFLDYAKINNTLERIKFTTSYDVEGRFLKQNSEQLFEENLKMLLRKYDNLHVVINTILTKQFCEKYISEKQSFLMQMIQKFGNNVSVNFLPYVALNEKLTPTKAQVFTILQQEFSNNRIFQTQYVNSMLLDQLKQVNKFVDGRFIDYTSERNSCGHPVNFSKYAKENGCFLCDLKELYGEN